MKRKRYSFNGEDITMPVIMQIRDVCKIIAHKKLMPFPDAVASFYLSQTCLDVQDVENGLWAESAPYIADRFFEEIGLPELVER